MTLMFGPLLQPEKPEVVRTKRKYEKKPKIQPFSTPQQSGSHLFNLKDLNQYDFPSSDEDPFSQVWAYTHECAYMHEVSTLIFFKKSWTCILNL